MKNDPKYGQYCLATSETDPACSPNAIKGPLSIFNVADISTLT